MADKPLTVKDLLNDDQRKEIAGLIADGDISKVLLIFEKDKRLYYKTTMENWSEMFGLVEMTRGWMLEDWLTDSEDGD